MKKINNCTQCNVPFKKRVVFNDYETPFCSKECREEWFFRNFPKTISPAKSIQKHIRTPKQTSGEESLIKEFVDSLHISPRSKIPYEAIIRRYCIWKERKTNE